MPEIVKLAEENAKVGEGPIWDADTQNLLWTDIQTGRLFRYADGCAGCLEGAGSLVPSARVVLALASLGFV